MSCTPGLGARTACGSEKSSVRLQWMPSFSSTSAAAMPSQVEAILISTRSREMPLRFIELDQLAAFGDRAFGVEREPRIRLGRDAARDDFQNLAAELTST